MITEYRCAYSCLKLELMKLLRDSREGSFNSSQLELSRFARGEGSVELWKARILHGGVEVGEARGR